jgi:multidrug resistance efflux pump
VDDLKDNVALLQAQLSGKRAEIKEAVALRERARRALSQVENLHKQGAISEGEIDRARTDLTVQEARLAGKEAQIQELEVRLRQARRRLARATSGRAAPAATSDSSVPANATTSSAVEVGAVRRHTTSPSVTSAGPSTAEPPGETWAAGRASRATTNGARDQEQRLRALERKLDTLLSEIDALRRELRQQRQGGSRPETSRSVPEGATTGRR